MFWRFGGKGLLHQSVNDGGVCRTAPATPDLLIIVFSPTLDLIRLQNTQRAGNNNRNIFCGFVPEVYLEKVLRGQFQTVRTGRTVPNSTSSEDSSRLALWVAPSSVHTPRLGLARGWEMCTFDTHFWITEGKQIANRQCWASWPQNYTQEVSFWLRRNTFTFIMSGGELTLTFYIDSCEHSSLWMVQSSPHVGILKREAVNAI